MPWEIILKHGILGNAAYNDDIKQLETLDGIGKVLDEMIANYHGNEPLTEIEIHLDVKSRRKLYQERRSVFDDQ